MAANKKQKREGAGEPQRTTAAAQHSQPKQAELYDDDVEASDDEFAGLSDDDLLVENEEEDFDSDDGDAEQDDDDDDAEEADDDEGEQDEEAMALRRQQAPAGPGPKSQRAAAGASNEDLMAGSAASMLDLEVRTISQPTTCPSPTMHACMHAMRPRAHVGPAQHHASGEHTDCRMQAAIAATSACSTGAGMGGHPFRACPCMRLMVRFRSPAPPPTGGVAAGRGPPAPAQEGLLIAAGQVMQGKGGCAGGSMSQ